MKNKLLTILFLILPIGLGWAAFAKTAYSAPNTIPVTDADAVFEPILPTESGFSATLRRLIDNLPDRLFLVRSPDGIFWGTLESLPTILSNLLDALPDAYFPVQSGDGVFMTTTFEYPSELTADNRPPIISNVQIEPITGLVEWNTDEFATSEARFGIEPGAYTEIISDTVWKTQHQLLPNTGGWNYILFRAMDRSGNVSEYYYPGYSISGMALDNNGDPIEGAAVWVEPVVTTQNTQAGEITLVTLTNENGIYDLSGIPSGEYLISIYHPDFAFDGQGFALNVNQDIYDINFEGESTNHFIYLPLTVK